MKLEFAKMHGAANDFVVLPKAPPPAPMDAQLSLALCDRRRGVGGDGALFLERLEQREESDPVFRMHFYNSDGSRAQMCFNGSRCCALRVVQLGWASGTFTFLTDYGLVRTQVDAREGRVRLWFDPPRAEQSELRLPKGSIAKLGHAVNTGDPHLVVELDREVFEELDFEEEARPLRWWTEGMPEGANVHMVVRGEEEWLIRSFERGVEGETWACGSGCIATVAALAGMDARERGIVLRTHGGDRIQVQPLSGEWSLEGPAVEVFSSTFEWSA